MNEVFYDFREHYATENQARVGIKFHVIKNLDASMFYMRDMIHTSASGGDDHWKTTPMVGLDTVISF